LQRLPIYSNTALYLPSLVSDTTQMLSRLLGFCASVFEFCTRSAISRSVASGLHAVHVTTVGL
jgi:hypothetical protein